MQDEKQKNAEGTGKVPINWEALSSDDEGDQNTQEEYENLGHASAHAPYYEQRRAPQYAEREYNND